MSAPQQAQPELWLGLSGEPSTGDQVATHLDAVAHLMRRDNWDPQWYGPTSDRRLEDAFLYTAYDGHGTPDTRYVGRQVMEHLLRTRLNAPYVDVWVWSEQPARTLDDLLGVLAEAASFARAHGSR
ncbi:hypothetical protein OG592_27155 [Streptomyces avidinii]|uniref:DUF6197 family protein n=1 Tax=Streptomyces avidinii TaxID=1895 RepID=UPI003869780A|nr:hypothetical protein OG592_27155 [Streptomyces avidinii]